MLTEEPIGEEYKKVSCHRRSAYRSTCRRIYACSTAEAGGSGIAAAVKFEEMGHRREKFVFLFIYLLTWVQCLRSCKTKGKKKPYFISLRARSGSNSRFSISMKSLIPVNFDVLF